MAYCLAHGYTTTRRQPPYRISVRPAEMNPEEREVRLRAAFNIILDEAFRRRGERPKKSRRRTS